MSLFEIIKTAAGNAFRSGLRTILTVLAIFVGAFTLTLTNGIGTGISTFITTQVHSIAADDVLTITPLFSTLSGLEERGGGPAVYDPAASTITRGGMNFEGLAVDDLALIPEIDGIKSVEPLMSASPDYISWRDGSKFQLTINPLPVGAGIDLIAGSGFNENEQEPQLILPQDYREALGFSDAAAAVGELVNVGISAVLGGQHEIEVRVAGVQEASLVSNSVSMNGSALRELHDLQTLGLPAETADSFSGAIARLEPGLAPGDIEALKAELAARDLAGMTVEDQLGAIQTVINAVVGVLNGFAVIALIAAGFGIINTLLMSVQERTREIGLMKALGMGSRGIFTLFSAEAIFIGFFGSAIGAAAAITVGNAISTALADGALSELGGFKLLMFDPLSVLVVTLLIMLLALLSGTLPATRAARQDPIQALRYE